MSDWGDRLAGLDRQCIFFVPDHCRVPRYACFILDRQTDSCTPHTYLFLLVVAGTAAGLTTKGTFSAITCTHSRGDESNAIDGDVATRSWMTADYASGEQTITATLPSSCALIGGVSWSTGPLTTRGTPTDDLSVRFELNGQTVSGVVDTSDPMVPASKFTTSPTSTGWHIEDATAESRSHSFTWPAVAATQLNLIFKVTGIAQWPIIEINPLCVQGKGYPPVPPPQPPPHYSSRALYIFLTIHDYW